MSGAISVIFFLKATEFWGLLAIFFFGEDARISGATGVTFF